ncbi:MAG: metallophosphoesterase [Eubacterium sp.]|nr:metallophosphoesterase [Eubacterium sp.]
MRKTAKAALALSGGLAAWAFLGEPRCLTCKKYTLGTGSRRLRLLQLSDMHIGPWMTRKQVSRLVRRVNGLSPDILLFTGDLYDRFMDWRREEDALPLALIKAPLGKYAVWGNHDRANMGRRYPELMAKVGFELLENTGKGIALAGGKMLWIAGVDDMLFGRPKRCRAEKTADYCVLMVHEPDAADYFKNEGYDLILSGHTHGGQVRLPLLPPVTTELGRKYLRGFYTLGKTRLYVNPGIGCTKLPCRLGAAPEITIFDIHL